jgi:hypothetical protein
METVTLKLGDRVRSRVSRFTGTLTAICEYLHGEPRFQITLDVPIDGETKREWFPLSELESAE